MGFRHSHIGINFTSKMIYIYIYMYVCMYVYRGKVSFDIEFKSYWN